MSRRTVISLAAFLIVGVAPIAIASTDAFAAKKAVQHRTAAAAAVIAPAPVVVGVIDNNYGPVADRIPRCFDSVILYPYPPCY
jgi:outer membrane lipoprotein SlyB